MSATIFILAWFVCGAPAYGILQGYWRWNAMNKWTSVSCSWREIAWDAIGISVCGLPGTVIALFLTGFARHGVRFRPWHTQAAHKKWGGI